MTNFFSPGEAERFVCAAFAEQHGRLQHILNIAELVRQSARDINELNPGTNLDETLAYCAGLLHDIGYYEPIAVSGFHPLDGYNFLEAQNARRIGELIVGHSSAPEEAELLGLALPQVEDNLIARLLTYWDMQVMQGGKLVSYQMRLDDIRLRYGESSIVVCAHQQARPRIEQIIAEIDRLLKKSPE